MASSQESSTGTREDALGVLRGVLATKIPDRSRDWWPQTQKRVSTGDASGLEAAFPALVRRCGREPLVEPEDDPRFLVCDAFVLDLAAYRRADATAVDLVTRFLDHEGDPAVLRRLFDQGDLDERVSVMRCLPLVGDHPVVLDLLGEAQRSNTQDVYEAAWCDHDLAARRLPEDEFNRMVLKLAFSDIPLWRVLDAQDRANRELSRMLQDFATEREAAGRPMWVDTLRLIARAPVEGTRARLIGHLEHGRDALRLAAAESIVHLNEPGMARFVRERHGRERHPGVREALERALDALDA